MIRPVAAEHSVSPTSKCDPACVQDGECSCTTPDSPDTDATQARSIAEIHAECLLPLDQRPGREAEFDALLHAAGRDWSRPAETRVRLVLDATEETRARNLAEREKACCSFFTFAFTRGGAGTLLVDVSVPASHTVVLDAMAERATVLTEES
ncbi:hypothetical protein [Haloactinomyces albus]|uniref:Arsenate reductase n=1 Tax=Haloactinomyces albus TaxID=1352928 RepID=A0AAE3ZHN5_9ACTN|nr:hypothetical protein [Haloactinomyces albus]MDR7304230.1 hypothetical protein [Haloactinomyces albus]